MADFPVFQWEKRVHSISEIVTFYKNSPGLSSSHSPVVRLWPTKLIFFFLFPLI